MGVFPGFGSWINQNSQQPLKAESKRSENVDSEEDDFKYPDKIYYDLKEEQKQNDLWHEAEKKHPWHNASPKIKVTHENGFYHMNIELTVGLAPEFLYSILIDPGSGTFRDLRKRRNLMENKSRKVLFENGPRQMTRVEKSVACNVFGVYIPISMNLIVDENRKDLMTQYKKEKVRFMKAFEGNYKVEPIFVDKERLCKKRIPMTREEYKKCSGGQGKVASKLTIDQYYQPYSPFNLPPLSWFLRGMTIKTSKSLLAQVQDTSIAVRTAIPMPKETTSNKHEKH
ncbi:PREDICTED: uncharacterized protein LOC106317047 [Brassica oleracea var. oleracea]|uniref:DUF220 domain-containing protein n=1 Tax=Brassica oleracea var. oleracea TaxID=109376 RepID=A0A0D3E1S2_BRAOL|nr:PREDICTED: uncharacterized protein LOC106317047 [Brassica oleracea var. oleracea]